jgi:hypothetical protein
MPTISRAHAAGVHRDDFVVEAWKATLVFGDQLRIKPGLAVARDLQLDVADVGNHRLLAITVSPVALFLAGEMMVYLSIENPLGPGPSSNRRAVRLGQKPSSDQRQPAAGQGRRRVCEVLCVVASSGSFAPIMPNLRTKFLMVPFDPEATFVS